MRQTPFPLATDADLQMSRPPRRSFEGTYRARGVEVLADLLANWRQVALDVRLAGAQREGLVARLRRLQQALEVDAVTVPDGAVVVLLRRRRHRHVRVVERLRRELARQRASGGR